MTDAPSVFDLPDLIPPPGAGETSNKAALRVPVQTSAAQPSDALSSKPGDRAPGLPVADTHVQDLNSVEAPERSVSKTGSSPKKLRPLTVQAGLFEAPKAPQVVEVLLEHIEEVTLSGAATALIKSVGELGVLTPVRLAPITGSDPSRPGEVHYRILDGQRRIHSARRFGHTSVRAIVTHTASLTESAITALSNLARGSNPVGEARALWRIMNECGLDDKGLAAALGLRVGVVRARLKLKRLPDSVLELIGDTLSIGVGERVAALPDNLRSEAVAQILQAAHRSQTYGESDLKAITVARQGAIGTLLQGALLSSAPPAPIDALVGEVTRLAQAYGVTLGGLRQALKNLEDTGSTADSPLPSPAQESLGQTGAEQIDLKNTRRSLRSAPKGRS